MTDQTLVGIHLGTSAVRVGVYDLDGELLDSGKALINEQTSVAWERAVRKAAPELPESGICSIASTSGTALLVDEYGEPVFPPQMYYESAPGRSEQLQQFEFDNYPVNWDVVLSSASPLSKVLLLRETHPKRFEDVQWILSPTTWLLYRLQYGNSTRWDDVETDWTNAMKFGADITAPVPEWFDSLFDATGLSRSLFPTIRPPGTYAGVAESEFADRTGFDGIKLFQGITDGSAFVLANGCIETGDFSLTFGATSVVKFVSEEITPHDALYYHRHPIEGYLPGASFESGNAMRWFFDRVINCTEQRGLELANKIAPGEEYEMFPAGNRGPFSNPTVGSSILGLEYDTELLTEDVHGRLARGLTTAIVLAESTYISLIEDHFETSIDRVQIMNNGAPTHQEDYAWWNTLRSSIWDRPVVEMEPRTTVGPLIPATLITGIYNGADEAVDSLLRQRSSVTPDSELAAEYEEKKESYLDQWQTITQLTSDDR
jgi:xylulokinase